MASPYLNIPQPAPAGGAPRQPAYNPQVRTTPLATASLVLGIISAIGAFCILTLPLAFIGLILGVIAIVKVGNSGGMLKGKGLATAGVLLCLVGLAGGGYFLMKAKQRVNDRVAGVKVIDHFKAAERKIGTKSGDKTGFGNSPEAEALAGQFAERLGLMRKIGIEGSAKKKPSLSGGSFLTFCQLDEDSCAFLVHVPDFRNFEDDAKDFINESAWMIAQQLLKETPLPDGAALAVATKGVLLYDEINIGRHLKEIDEDGSNRQGIERTPHRDENLKPFFPEPTVIEPEPKPAEPQPN